MCSAQILIFLSVCILTLCRGSTVCTSLEGPYCSLVNGKRPPSHVQIGQNGILKDSSQSLSDSVPTITVKNIDIDSIRTSNNARSKVQEDGAQPEQSVFVGNFKFEGKFQPSTDGKTLGSIVLTPVKWIKKPGPDWIMVGFRGSLTESADKLMIKAQLYTSEGEHLKQCSDLVATRPKPADLTKVESIFRNSLWQGSYTCGSLPTEMHLEVKSAVKDQNGYTFRGRFSFTAAKSDATVTELLQAISSQISLKDVKLTASGCECIAEWKHEGKVQRLCSNPNKVEKPWCKIVPGTCDKKPFGVDWDFCVDNWEDLVDSKTEALQHLIEEALLYLDESNDGEFEVSGVEGVEYDSEFSSRLDEIVSELVEKLQITIEDGPLAGEEDEEEEEEDDDVQ